ncbi:hypothetical protein RCC89_14740 [Cytophagaceae bacterium ABcell3]|nr:hypothetical protein RCC89_14740 [Cytophagaceae bacterium ABcell3]
MKETEIELEKNKRFLHKVLYADFNLISINPKLNNWHTLSWEVFRKELSKEHVDVANCKHRNWKKLFVSQKRKINNLMGKLLQDIEKMG